MDFFAAEDRANRSTVMLVILYLLSIIVVVIATDAAIAAAIAMWAGGRGSSITVYGVEQISFDSAFTFLLPWVGLAVTLIVVIATLIKANELRGGGTIFAALLGARFLSDAPTDPAEARLKNVVEEMALAAGVKAPAICVLDNEPGINAFAAGANNRDPVIGVTAGCLTHLNRDELQGIVGHEFSHILHNDTTLNTRAYAMLFGLLAISLIGGQMVAATFEVNDGFGRNRGGGGPIVIIGLIMLVIGWVGGLAGRMVRAAMVRQREYLADASAVQYTRNADGVASALYKMATQGSDLRHAIGDEAEHFLFGAGTANAWGRFGLTRTHPLTATRINAIRPGYQPSGIGAIPVSQLDDNVDTTDVPQDCASVYGDPVNSGVPPGPAMARMQADRQRNLMPGATVVGSQQQGAPQLVNDVTDLFPATDAISGGAIGAAGIGGVVGLAAVAGSTGGGVFVAPTPASLDQSAVAGGGSDSSTSQTAGAHSMPVPPAASEPTGRASGPPANPGFAPPKPPASVLSKIPADLQSAAGNAESAAAVCFALAAADIAPEKWETRLTSFADSDTTSQVNSVLSAIKSLTLQPRMALIDLLVPGLQSLPGDEQSALVQAAASILPLTDQPDIVAMGVFWRLTRYLGAPPPEGQKANSWADGAAHVAVLLAALARLQFGPGVLAPNAYQEAAHAMSALGPLPAMPAPGDTRPANIQTALIVLAAASPATRDAVVKAAATIIDQEEIPEAHADLLVRMVCDAADLDVPTIIDRWI